VAQLVNSPPPLQSAITYLVKRLLAVYHAHMGQHAPPMQVSFWKYHDLCNASEDSMDQHVLIMKAFSKKELGV
jgi:hypothetical protein